MKLLKTKPRRRRLSRSVVLWPLNVIGVASILPLSYATAGIQLKPFFVPLPHSYSRVIPPAFKIWIERYSYIFRRKRLLKKSFEYLTSLYSLLAKPSIV
jgi:hypothetical protein